MNQTHRILTLLCALLVSVFGFGAEKTHVTVSGSNPSSAVTTNKGPEKRHLQAEARTPPFCPFMKSLGSTLPLYISTMLGIPQVMKLNELDSSQLLQAIGIYLAKAYPDGSVPSKVNAKIDGMNQAQGSLCFDEPRFEIENSDGNDRYFLRLGNHGYPHMKLGFVDCAGAEGEYVFVADTHDRHFDLDPNLPDFDSFHALQGENEAIKAEIEQAWTHAGLPTETSFTETPKSSNPPGNKGKTVLLVDDTDMILLVQKVAFSRAGFHIIACESGLEALEHIRTNVIDVCVLDVMMPGMNGFEVIEALNAEGLKAFPIILCTATHENNLRLELVDDLVRKPFRPDYLVERANALL